MKTTNHDNSLKVILIMVMSANGIVAQKKIQNSFDWNSEEDRKQFMEKIKEIGTVFMGANTFKSIGKKPYQGIDFFVLTNHPEEFGEFDNVTYVSGEVADIYRQIQEKGIKQIALLGGPATNGQFLDRGLVDELYLTVEPLMMPEGLRLTADMEKSVKLKLEDSSVLGNSNTLLLHYLIETLEAA